MAQQPANSIKERKPLTPADINLLRLSANTIRVLAMDAVQKANSGHPGLPLGMADAAAVLWTRHLRHNPADPHWINRDRFVLSAGHGSMLLYSLLHLTGYDVTMDDLKSFRQWGSRTPGHPEYGHTPGVETTTGPLGQGITNAVGMAMAERCLADRYNQPNFDLIDHYTYVIAGDGDLMEGISHEACSLAGHLKLGKLIVLYDDNQISIDGSTDLAFSEDVPTRFRAYGWHTLRVDGHDHTAVDEAIQQAKAVTDQPTLIACKTTIGFGSPNRAGTAKAHGEPLGEEEIVLTKKELGIANPEPFYVPDDVRTFMGAAKERGARWQMAWEDLRSDFSRAYPAESQRFEMQMRQTIDLDWEQILPHFSTDKPLATRAASGKVLDALVPVVPQLLGGSADLTGSNNTKAAGAKIISADDFSGHYIHYGVREHGMGGIMNGLALHGGFIPFGGTFLVFSDYMRGSLRLASLMGQQVVYVFTHDSIGLGEDGPTHQPIEHLAALRAIPNFVVIRPADAAETAYAWKAALQRSEGPTALALTRQKLPVLDREKNGYAPASSLEKGAYLVSAEKNAEVILVGSGSELHIALEAAEVLRSAGRKVNVVSMPSWELFDAQPQEYRDAVLSPAIPARVAIEAGATQGWHKYVGEKGRVISLDRFGASAPYETIYDNLGLTAEHVSAEAERLIEQG